MTRQELVTVQDAQLSAMWDSFLHARMANDLDELATSWPDRQALDIPFQDVEENDPRLAELLLDKPAHVVRIARATAWNLLRDRVLPDTPPLNVPRPRIAIHGLPPSRATNPAALRSDDLGHLVAVRGMVTAASEAYLELLEGTFECALCTTIATVIQEGDGTRQEPVICETCEKPTRWRLLEDQSRFIDAQIVRLQQTSTELQDGHSPSVLTVHMTHDLVMKAPPGSRVLVTGIVALKFRRANGKLTGEADRQLQALHVVQEDHDQVDLTTSSEELAHFRELATRPGIHDELARCIAPDILGLQDVKMACLYSFAGGVDQQRPDGSRMRNRIHVLVAGDPGVAKSKLLGRIPRYVPRAVQVFGFDANRVGLGGGLVKDEVTGRWMLEPGSLVIGHRRVVTIDELGLLDPDDRPALHSATEDGYVSINKIVKATHPAEATIIAAMNPASHRFDLYAPLIEQLGLTPALRSRFDLMFCLRDVPNKDRDLQLAARLLAPLPVGVNERDHYHVILAGDEFRRYIQLALTVQPVMTNDAQAMLTAYYQEARGRDADNPTLTARQLDALRRLSVASARIRLSPKVEPSDARRAMDLMAASLQSCGVMDDRGVLDNDLLVTGVSKAQHDRVRLILQLVRDLQRGSALGLARGYATVQEVVEAADAQGVPKDAVEKTLKHLVDTSQLYHRNGGGTYAILR